MVDSVMNLLEATTPELRRRYLERIKMVAGPQARELERRLSALVEQERREALKRLFPPGDSEQLKRRLA